MHSVITNKGIICFAALTIIRLLQKNLKDSFSSGRILDSLVKSCCSLVKDNVHLFDYNDDVLTEIGSLLGIDFSQKYRTQAGIKNVVASVKTF